MRNPTVMRVCVCVCICVCLCVMVCVLFAWFVLPPSFWLRHVVQPQIKMTRAKMLPFRSSEMIIPLSNPRSLSLSISLSLYLSVSLSLSLSLSHSPSPFPSALAPLNKSLIPKNTVSSLPAISLTFLRLPLPLLPSLFPSILVLFCTAALPLLCCALSLSLCLAFHSNPPIAFHIRNTPPPPPIPLTVFHILD